MGLGLGLGSQTHLLRVVADGHEELARGRRCERVVGRAAMAGGARRSRLWGVRQRLDSWLTAYPTDPQRARGRGRVFRPASPGALPGRPNPRPSALAASAGPARTRRRSRARSCAAGARLSTPTPPRAAISPALAPLRREHERAPKVVLLAQPRARQHVPVGRVVVAMSRGQHPRADARWRAPGVRSEQRQIARGSDDRTWQAVLASGGGQRCRSASDGTACTHASTGRPERASAHVPVRRVRPERTLQRHGRAQQHVLLTSGGQPGGESAGRRESQEPARRARWGTKRSCSRAGQRRAAH